MEALLLNGIGRSFQCQRATRSSRVALRPGRSLGAETCQLRPKVSSRVIASGGGVPYPVRAGIKKIAVFLGERVGDPRLPTPVILLLTRDRLS